MKYILLTTYYKSEDEERNIENKICLEQNILNNHISKIYLFLQSTETIDLPNHPKIEYVKNGKRPTFHDFFKFSNFIFEEDTRIIIANSDIYFDETLKLLENINIKNSLITLTRWDLQYNHSSIFYNKYLSQDSWIFSKKINEQIGQYFIGQHGCDNRLLYELKQDGIEIINPSLSVKSTHVHMSQLRPYFNDKNYKYVDPPYLYSLPSGLVSPLKLFIYRFLNTKKFKVYKFSLKDYYYIRFEYHYNISKNKLQKINSPKYNRFTSSIIYPFYYVFFKISALISI